MSSQILPFISDKDFYTHTKKLVEAAKSAELKVEKNPYTNIIDPFSALVDAARQNVSLSTWMDQEKSRQIQKSFQNAIGDFHQNIIGSVKGWENSGAGGSFDVISKEKKIIAEIKNKHNTMNSTSQLGTYDKLASWLDYGKKGYIAYVVEIVPKSPKPYSVSFTPTERGVKRQTRNNLLRTDGRSFYALSSGYENAIDLLYNALPKALGDILKIDDKTLKGTEEFHQLFKKAYIKK